MGFRTLIRPDDTDYDWLVVFYNCWFHRRDAGVWLEGNQGFYHFHGGQLSGGINATTSDDRGACLTSGKSFTTGQALGTCGASFIGVTFERGLHGWNIRHFGAGTHPTGLSLYCAMCSFFGGQNTGEGAIGVLKLTGGYNDILKFDCCTVNGIYTNAIPISIAGAGGASRPYYTEIGSRGIPEFDGAVLNMNENGMLYRSLIQRAHAESMLNVRHNNIVLSYADSGNILVSTNGGASFPNRISVEPHP